MPCPIKENDKEKSSLPNPCSTSINFVMLMAQCFFGTALKIEAQQENGHTHGSELRSTWHSRQGKIYQPGLVFFQQYQEMCALHQIWNFQFTKTSPHKIMAQIFFLRTSYFVKPIVYNGNIVESTRGIFSRNMLSEHHAASIIHVGPSGTGTTLAGFFQLVGFYVLVHALQALEIDFFKVYQLFLRG